MFSGRSIYSEKADLNPQMKKYNEADLLTNKIYPRKFAIHLPP